MLSDDLIVRTSMVLYKFSEHNEDWDEWRELAESLEEAVASGKMGRWNAAIVQRRLNDYYCRLHGMRCHICPAQERCSTLGG